MNLHMIGTARLIGWFHIDKAIMHAAVCRCEVVLIAPAWKSATFWPLLFPFGGEMHNGVIKILTIEGKNVFKRGTQRNSVFSERAVM